MSKVLLIGSTGKIGKCVLKELLSNNFEIGLLIRNLSNREIDNSYKKLKLFEGDITVQHSLDIAIQWADVVINCAGYVSYKRNDGEKLQISNVEGVHNIVQACSRFNKKLIHTSSAVIYGSAKQPILFQEDKYPKEVYKSAYSNSKIEAEKIVMGSGISKIVLRPSSLISKNKSTLKNLYSFYKKGFIPGLKGGASFALIQDAAKAYIPALHLLLKSTVREEMIFNLGGNNLTLKEVFERFQSIDYRKTLFIPDSIMYLLSIINDFVLFPLFKYSLITYENYQTSSHFTFLDSTKAMRLLDYKITPFDLSLKEIM